MFRLIYKYYLSWHEVLFEIESPGQHFLCKCHHVRWLWKIPMLMGPAKVNKNDIHTLKKHTHTHTRAHTHARAHTHTHTHTHTSTHAHTHTHTHTNTNTNTHISMVYSRTNTSIVIPIIDGQRQAHQY